MDRISAHRGANDDMVTFAQRFVKGRLAGYEKDMEICLTPVKSKTRSGNTHAYFPALSSCCGTLEYLTGLFRGNIRKIGWQQVNNFAEVYLPQPDYNSETVRILVEAFRHSVAHRGIASGVWVDRNQGGGLGRRLTWKILADSKHPACEIVEERGELRRDSPWACPYTHRVHIHLRSMWVDIRNAANIYTNDIGSNQNLLKNFEKCMKQLYPK